MQTISMHDLEQFSYWQEKGLRSAHWYNICNPVISVDLTEFYDLVLYLGVVTNIPIFAFFPWTVSLSRTFLAMLD